MTDSNTHLVSVPGTRSHDNPVESECTPQKSSRYRRYTYVPPSSHISLGRNNSGDDGGVLQPGPSGESDFEVANKKFAFSLDQRNKLLNPKNFGALSALGGLCGLEKGLRTDVRSGLGIDETVLEDTVNIRVVARPFVPPQFTGPICGSAACVWN